MSEAGKATATLLWTPAARHDPAPKSPVGGGTSQAQAPAPCALVTGNPCVLAAPAFSAPAGTEDPEKKVLATKVLGTVKWFNVRNGYGFISRNDTREDVFVHQTAIIKENHPRKYPRRVGEGETVEFEEVEGERGAEAAHVTGPAGAPVEGSRYAAHQRRYRRGYCGRCQGNSRKAGEIGEMKDGVPGGAQLPGPGLRNPAYLTRYHRRPPSPRPAPAVGETGESQQEGNGPNEPSDRGGYWRPYNCWRRPGPPNAPSQDGKETKAGEASSPESPAPATQQSGAE